jgi:hypothetical protein
VTSAVPSELLREWNVRAWATIEATRAYAEGRGDIREVLRLRHEEEEAWRRYMQAADRARAAHD